MDNNKKDDESKRIQEYRELLKLKQGLIEESEIIPESGYEGNVELHGRKKIENFFYHYKWRLIIGVLVAAFLAFMIYQTASREKKDLYVLVISTTADSGLYTKLNDIETALEKYCPDFDGNGKVHVGLNYIDLNTSAGMSEYTDAQNYKFTSELFTGDSQMYVADTAIIGIINDIAGEEVEFFQNYSEEYPDATFYEGCGLQLNTTQLTQDARWSACPDTIGIYVREVFDNMTGNDSDAQEQRERAEIVMKNIIEGNVVNP